MENQPLLFWICAGVLTLASLVAALWPLLREKPHQNDRSQEYDHAGERRVLIDQLDEIERDRNRGLLNDEEAKSTRAELARRLLALERSSHGEVAGSTLSSRFYPWASIVIIPALAVGGYHYLGSPGLPDQPISARLSAPTNQQDLNIVIARIEAHLQTNPDDLKGWQTLAPIYRERNQLDDAEKAYRNWIKLVDADLPSKTKAQIGLGRVLSAKNNGKIKGEAFDLFEQASQNAPDDPTPMFFRAIGLTQQRDTSKAIVAWTDLIEKFGESNPPWITMAKRTLATLKEQEQETSSPDASQ